MHICKINKKGWESYTGLLGFVPFENGVSTRPLTDREVLVIGASIELVRLDNNEQIGPAVNMVKARHLSAEVKTASKAVQEEAVIVAKPKHTKESLEALASEGGIKAVREIAKNFDIRGVEISKMIDDILLAQVTPKEKETN